MKKQSAEANSVALVIGAGSAIASKIVEHLVKDKLVDRIIAVSRTVPAGYRGDEVIVKRVACDYTEPAISSLCDELSLKKCVITYVFICNGMLHDRSLEPEKRLEDVSASKLEKILHVNTIIPMLWLAKLTPFLKSKEACRIAVFSARVGSISDNRSGGWYAYRASKAALNMLIRTTALELNRRAPNVKLIAFHPGTTDTELSKPFQKSVPPAKLFTPDFVAGALIAILRSLNADSDEEFIDWDGKPVPW